MSTDSGIRVLRLVIASLFLLSIGGFDHLPPTTLLFSLLLVLLGVSFLGKRIGTVAALGALIRPRSFGIALGGLVLVGLVIRLTDIGHGLGHVPIDVDEERLAASVKHFMVTGTIDHSTVEHYPGVHFWLLTASSLVAYLLRLVSGTLEVFDQVPTEVFVLVGRTANAFLDAGTIVLTGLLGRTMAGPAAGLIAAGLMAGAPVSLAIGTQNRNDSALCFLAMAAAYVSIARSDISSRTAAVVAGAIAGCATGVKYSGVFALFPVLLSAVFARASDRVGQLSLSLAGFAVALAVTNHFLWADVPNFLQQLFDQIAITGPGHWAASGNPRWFYTTTLAENFGWPLVIIAAGFAAWGLATGHRKIWTLLVFPLFYTWFMTGRPSQFSRWVYPLLPFTAVAASAGLLIVVGEFRRVFSRGGRSDSSRFSLESLPGAALVLACLAPFAWQAATPISWRLTEPPYASAEGWLFERAQPGDDVLTERGSLDFSRMPVRVRPVSALESVLGGGYYELQVTRWVVVPEWHFGNPGLGKLDLAADFKATWTFGGTRGIDYRIYSARPVKPLESCEIALDTPEAADVLGREWSRDDSGLPGLSLPRRGAEIFLPADEDSRIELKLLVPNLPAEAGAVPIRVRLDDDKNVELETVPLGAGRVGVLTISRSIGTNRRVTSLRLEPLIDQVRVLSVGRL